MNVGIIVTLAGAIFTTLDLISTPPKRYCTSSNRDGCFTCPENSDFCKGTYFNCKDGFTKVLAHCVPESLVPANHATGMKTLTIAVRNHLRKESGKMSTSELKKYINQRNKDVFIFGDTSVSDALIKLAVNLTDEFEVPGDAILQVYDKRSRNRVERLHVALPVVLWVLLAVLIYRRTLL